MLSHVYDSILRHWLTTLLCVSLTCVALTTEADDTDIYLKASSPTGGEPLVMFVLDWRPNLGATVQCPVGSYCAQLRADGYLADGKAAASGQATTFFDMLRAVLTKVIDPLGGVRIGFMLNHANKNGCAGFPPATKCSNGAYVPLGFRSMIEGVDDQKTWQTLGEDSDKVEFVKLLADIPMPQGAQSHPFQGKELYFELFRYLTGQGIYNGHTGFIDFGDGPNDTLNLDQDRPNLDWDASIENASKTQYVSPLSIASQCTKIYVINLMFQVSQVEDDSDAAIRATKANGGMQGINLTGSNNHFATVVKYMNDADLADGSYGTAPNLSSKQNVVSYFIVDPTKINTTTTGYAAAGGTGVPLALSDDPELLVNTLQNVFKSILSVSTTFVAPSVPVNVFNRAEIINEVFLALFEADKDALPFWPGNLKKVKIANNVVTGVPELQDFNGVNAIDIDGRLKHSALTFWTAASSLAAPTDAEVAGKDGRSIKRGGAGQKIPGFISANPGLNNSLSGARQLFTEDTSNLTNGLLPLGGDAITATAVWGDLTARWSPATTAISYVTATSIEKDKAVLDLRYLRGYTAAAIADTTSARTWFLGDPLHSRPRPINYGARSGYSKTNPDIRILMATTDGVLHLFTNTGTDGSQSGAEKWGFIPRQALAGQQRLRTAQKSNSPVHPISFDGSPVIYQLDTDRDGTIEPSEGDKVYAFIGMRRGGKAYYALDITDPDAPKFLWKIDQSMPDFAQLGQTWSNPSIGHIDAGSGIKPVIIFGGGYNGDDRGDNVGDLGKDAANRNGAYGSNDDEGNAVFVVDATTGALVWKAVKGATQGYSASSKAYSHPNLEDSIPADLAAADMNGDGKIDRLYFGDTGGRVWRADLAGSDPRAWTLSVLMNAGRHFNSAATNDLRFFNRPDIVKSKDSAGSFDAVLIGSGDRENPLNTTMVNKFFLLKDRATTSGSPSSTTLIPTNLADLSVDCVSAGNCTTATQDNLTHRGWFLGLTSTGEKNLAAAVTAGGTVFFTTFVPSAPSGTCGLSEGSGFVYAVSLGNAQPVHNYDTANDLAGLVLDRRDALGGGGIPVEIVPIGDKYVLIQGQEVGQNVQAIKATTNWRTYWYEVPK